jgi:ribonuclease T2
MSMKTTPLALIALLFAAPLAAQPVPTAPDGTPAGQFDSYVFALTWEPTFCEGKSFTECANMTPDSFDAKNLTLHGLWPDRNGDSKHAYGDCGVGSDIQQNDHGGSWCKMPALGLTDATLSVLTPVMPGVASCLQNHEWYKHGSCSGLAPDDFFTQAAGLAAHVADTGLGRFLTAHVGQNVSPDDLFSAFETDFGAGSRSSVTLSCTNVGGTEMLSEIHLSLSPKLLAPAELGAMLVPANGAGPGNCPASFLLDPAGSRGS